MRRKLLYICGILWVFALFQMIVNYEEKAPDITTAFTDDMYLNIEGNIKAVSFYGKRYLQEEDKITLIKELAENLGIKEPYAIEPGDNEITLIKTGREILTSITLITEESQVSDGILSQKQYITLEMNLGSSVGSMLYYHDKIKDMFEENDLSADVYMTVRGDIEGELSNTDKNILADKILKNMGGDIVTENRNSDRFSIYAYSDQLDDYVVYGNNKMNINIVVDYNDSTGQTEVYMSTPIMNEDY